MTFADEVKRWLSPRSVGGQLALLIIVLSLIAGRWPEVAEQVVLQPAAVIEHFKLWQLVTHAFLVATEAWTLIFTVVICLQAGSFLETQWGARRIWIFVVLVHAISGVVTVLLGFATARVAAGFYLGSTATILWVAEGVVLGPRQVNFFFFPITGYALAVIGAASPLVTAWARGWTAVVNQLLAIAVTVAWVKGYTPARLLLWFRSRSLERELKRRGSHLSVVQGQKRDRDQYLN